MVLGDVKLSASLSGWDPMNAKWTNLYIEHQWLQGRLVYFLYDCCKLTSWLAHQPAARHTGCSGA